VRYITYTTIITYSFINTVIKDLGINRSNFVYVKKFSKPAVKKKPFDVLGAGILENNFQLHN
jgi:hypothetical protein